MIKIAVYDDCSAYRNKIEQLIFSYNKNDSISVNAFSSGEEFLAFPDYASFFDIIFLDVEMDGVSGLDAAKEIRKKNSDVIIFFITSYVNHVPDSFRLGAFQFLVRLTGVEPVTVSLAAFFRLACVHFCKATALLQISRCTFRKNSVERNSLTLQTNNFL